jgi:hypothetical protein
MPSTGLQSIADGERRSTFSEFWNGWLNRLDRRVGAAQTMLSYNLSVPPATSYFPAQNSNLELTRDRLEATQ